MKAERAAVDRLLADVIAKQRNATTAILALNDEDAAAPVRDALRFLSEQRKGLEAEREVLEDAQLSKTKDGTTRRVR